MGYTHIWHEFPSSSEEGQRYFLSIFAKLVAAGWSLATDVGLAQLAATPNPLL